MSCSFARFKPSRALPVSLSEEVRDPTVLARPAASGALGKPSGKYPRGGVPGGGPGAGGGGIERVNSALPGGGPGGGGGVAAKAFAMLPFASELTGLERLAAPLGGGGGMSLLGGAVDGRPAGGGGLNPAALIGNYIPVEA